MNFYIAEMSTEDNSDEGESSLKSSKKTAQHDDGSYEGKFGNPVYKQIAMRNGEINRMTKEDIRKKLAELNLDTKGLKEVLKKRLKNHYKKQKLMIAAVKPVNGTPHFNHLLVIDFEATCQEHNPAGFKYEIIEFPVILVDTHKRKVVGEFHAYVRPVINPHLSSFCTSLTGIKQSTVDRAAMFPSVMKDVTKWLISLNLHPEYKKHKFAVVTDGPWDMARFLHMQCCLSNVPFPRWARKWINIRKSFSNFYGFRRSKLNVMLENMGMVFEGHPHSGIDDARNIARIVVRMLDDGADLRVNERLFPHKLRDIAELEQQACIAAHELQSDDDSDSECEPIDGDDYVQKHDHGRSHSSSWHCVTSVQRGHRNTGNNIFRNTHTRHNGTAPRFQNGYSQYSNGAPDTVDSLGYAFNNLQIEGASGTSSACSFLSENEDLLSYYALQKS